MPAKNLTRINDVATYSHIYNGGVEERIIFESVADYEVFLGFLKDYLTPQDPGSIKKDFKVHGRIFQGVPHLPKNYFNEVELIAYSLMPDRFHLILHQKTRGSIERFLRSLCTRYSMYFNKKYHRSGSLFEGPYKSVQVKDKLRLSRLTAFLHHSGDNSSYPEYLGSRNTPWVKQQIVLSLFKGTGDYKDFVEKYQPDQNEKQLSKSDHLERRSPASNKDLRTDSDLKIRSRMPQFLAISTLVFVLLVTFSVWNINISAAKSPKPLPSPAVLAETQKSSPSATPEATSAAILEASATAEMSTAPADAVKSEVKPETTLTVKIGDGSSYVNIRQKPTTNSEKIGQAHDGDTFAFISVDSGWYEIRLADGQRGFISKKYTVTNEGDN